MKLQAICDVSLAGKADVNAAVAAAKVSMSLAYPVCSAYVCIAIDD